jgi:alkylation response protein AidB-like acyl-CoA dehydrogenase
VGFRENLEAQEQLRDAVRRCMERHADIRRFVCEPGTEGGRVDTVLYRRVAAEMGLAGLMIPERFGGSGAGVGELAAVFEELGAWLAPVPLFATAGLAVPAILVATRLGADRDETAARLLGGIADGTVVVTLAVAEPSGRYAPALTSATAERGADGWALSGRKDYVVDGTAADVLLVPARTADAVALFAVETTAPGAHVRGMPGLDLLRGLAEVRLDRVPARLIGRVAATGEELDPALDLALILLAAEQVGGARHCLDSAVAYAKQRVQFGRPIGSFQSLKHLLVDLLLDLELARSALGHAVGIAAEYLNEPGPESERNLAEAASLVRSMCSEAYMRIADESLHVHGGIGFTWEHECHLYYRRAKATELLFGDPYQHRERLAATAGLRP